MPFRFFLDRTSIVIVTPFCLISDENRGLDFFSSQTTNHGFLHHSQDIWSKILKSCRWSCWLNGLSSQLPLSKRHLQNSPPNWYGAHGTLAGMRSTPSRIGDLPDRRSSASDVWPSRKALAHLSTHTYETHPSPYAFCSLSKMSLFFMSKRTQSGMGHVFQDPFGTVILNGAREKFDFMIVRIFLCTDFSIEQSWVWVWSRP
jgi:hypothetical protein